MSADEIYRNFTQARGGDGLASAAEMVRKLVGEYEQQADEIIQLAGAMESAWQGDAAGAAQRGAGPLAVAHAQAAPAIDVAQDLSMRQVGSFGDARNSVRPVPAEPTVPDPWMMVTSPDASATYAGQVAAYNAAAQHNVDVMSGYDNASTYNTSRLPSSYGALLPDDSGMSVGAQASRPGTDQPSPGTAPGPGATSGDRPTPGGGPLQQTDPGGFRPAQGSPGSGVPGANGVSAAGNGSGGDRLGGPGSLGGTGSSGAFGTSGSGAGGQLGSSGPGFGGPGGIGVGSGQPGPGGRIDGGSGAGSGFGSRGGAGAGPGGRLGGAPGGGFGGGPRGEAGTGGRLGSGLGGEAGSGGRSGGGPGGEAGGRSGSGRGAGVGGVGQGVGAAAGEAVGRGGGARAGLGGVPVSGVGAGRSRSAEDEEHERPSYLQDPDPEATFGTDERTTPPVIE